MPPLEGGRNSRGARLARVEEQGAELSPRRELSKAKRANLVG